MAVDPTTVVTKTRELPWRNLVTEFPPDTKFSDALEQIGLNYEVGFSPLFLSDGTPLDDRRATIIKDRRPMEYLGIVGSRYTIVQNRDAFSFLENIVDSGDLKPLGGGWFKGGARPWIQARLPEDIVINGDAHIPFIFCANSHDGGLPVTVSITTIRVICENTFAMNVGAQRRFQVRHLNSVDGKIAEARKVLDLSHRYFEQFKVEMESLAEQNISDDSFRSVVERIFPMGDPNKMTDEQREAVARKRAQMLGVYTYSPLLPKGNKYGAMQAVTEWYDHWKNGQRGDARAKAERKANDLLLGDGLEWKDRALGLLRAAK